MGWLDWLVAWLLGIWIAAVIARHRGRDGLTWALFAALGSPLMILVLLAMPSLKKENREAD